MLRTRSEVTHCVVMPLLCYIMVFLQCHTCVLFCLPNVIIANMIIMCPVRKHTRAPVFSLFHFFLLNLNAFVYFMYPVCLVKHLRVCSFQFNANVYHCVRVCNVMLIFDRPISHSLTNKRVRVRCPSVIN